MAGGSGSGPGSGSGGGGVTVVPYGRIVDDGDGRIVDDSGGGGGGGSTGGGRPGPEPFRPRAWPDGRRFLSILEREGILASLSKRQRAPVYWQVCARYALLKKYGLLRSRYAVAAPDDGPPGGPENKKKKKKNSESDDNGAAAFADAAVVDLVEPSKLVHPPTGEERHRRYEWVFTDQQADAIQKRWNELIDESERRHQQQQQQQEEETASRTAVSPSCTGDGAAVDMIELLDPKSDGRSNARPLQWSVMRCGASQQFRLHAHPNLELIYCARGELHEVRMSGPPYTRRYEPADDDDGGDDRNDNGTETRPRQVRGPDLRDLERPWHFATLPQGEWLVNEVGSVHKSFTSSRGLGWVGIVLWGGSHADVAPESEPASPRIQSCVDAMDAKITTNTTTTTKNSNATNTCPCATTKWEDIAETFLPESERSSSSSTKRKSPDNHDTSDGSNNENDDA